MKGAARNRELQCEEGNIGLQAEQAGESPALFSAPCRQAGLFEDIHALD